LAKNYFKKALHLFNIALYICTNLESFIAKKLKLHSLTNKVFNNYYINK